MLPGRSIPWCTLAVLASAVVVSASSTLHSLAVYDRGLVQSGEVWRIFTGHWVHFSGSHLLLDTLALGLAGQFLESRARRLWFAFLAMVPWWIGGGLLVLNPALEVYGGLSGLAVGAVALTSVVLWQERGESRRIGGFLGGLVLAKLLAEAAGMDVSARLPDGITVSWWSHWLGALGALIVITLGRNTRELRKNLRLLGAVFPPSVTLGFGGAENRSGACAGEESPNTAGRDAA